jgi:branched-chain amino acid transport system ATP-binding protein
VDELRIENIQAAYKRIVLKGVNLSFRKGEIVAFVGPNGAGKSTFLKVIAGILSPLKGRIWFRGQDITALTPHERVELGLAYFIQGAKVFSSLTVVENLEMATLSLPSAERFVRIDEIFNMFTELRDLRQARAGTLSGGERHALALGMLLIKQPELLLLDEFSVGLSPSLAQFMLGKVREFNTKYGATLLLVEHNVRAVMELADRVVVLMDGEVAADLDKPEELLMDSRLTHLLGGLEHATLHRRAIDT